MSETFDILGFFGTLFWLVIIAIFVLVVRNQFEHATPESYAMVMLSVRACTILPAFMTFIAFSLWGPELYAFWKVPAAVIEGYGLYCFYAFLAKGVGGADRGVELVNTSQKELPCGCCWDIKKRTQHYYERERSLIWAFAFIRPPIMLLGMIFFYADVQVMYALLNFVGSAITIAMLPGLFLSVYALYEECDGLNLLTKFIVVKVSVGVVLIEDLVMNILYQSGTVDIPSSMGVGRYNEEEKFIRVYCTIALAQGMLLAYAMYKGFATKMELKAVAEDRPGTPRPESIWTFLWDIMVVSKFSASTYLALTGSVKSSYGSKASDKAPALQDNLLSGNRSSDQRL
jgi:hypothetical protein